MTDQSTSNGDQADHDRADGVLPSDKPSSAETARPVSDKQLQANRANAQRSTGPRSDEASNARHRTPPSTAFTARPSIPSPTAPTKKTLRN